MQPESLARTAAKAHDQFQQLLAFDVLRDARDSEHLAQSNHCAEQPLPVPAVLSGCHKGAVELDLIEPQFAQITD